MEFSNKKPLVRNGIIALIIFCYLLPNELADGRYNSLKMQKHKGPIKTIESENGEVIDCVDIYKQPAFDHPLLKNHKIQMWSSSSGNGAMENDENVDFQTWHKNGEYCPEGSVPIVRTPKSNYPKKVSFIPRLSRNRLNRSLAVIPERHEYAQVSVNDGNFYGTNATLNVWNPITFSEEFSMAQIWVVAGQDQTLNTVEAGWMINFLDTVKQPKIFIYWTKDNYMDTGCYDFNCPGFVQVSSKAAVGVAIHPISTYNGPQYDITISIFKDRESGNWWLKIHNVEIGYWPGSLFTRLTGSADELHWGGEIINRQPSGHHTTTQMGSGHFPFEGFRKASFFRNIQFINQDGIYKDPENLIPYASKPSCYDVKVKDKGPLTGVHFYYGGPGYSAICP